MSDKLDIVIEFDAPAEKRSFLSMVSGWAGKKRVTVCDARARRTDRQNRYYWPCFVHPFAEFLRQQGEAITDGEAHDMLRVKFLRTTTFHPITGNPIGQKFPSTTTLSTAEFNEYLDKIAHWLNDQFGIVVPDPAVYRVIDAPPKAKRQKAVAA